MSCPWVRTPHEKEYMGGDPLGVRIIKPKPMKCLKDYTWAFERECGIELGRTQRARSGTRIP